jgi:hypothetical protein
MDISSLVYAFFNTPGVGGAVILTIFTGACLIYVYLTRWILRGGRK